MPLNVRSRGPYVGQDKIDSGAPAEDAFGCVCRPLKVLGYVRRPVIRWECDPEDVHKFAGRAPVGRGVDSPQVNPDLPSEPVSSCRGGGRMANVYGFAR